MSMDLRTVKHVNPVWEGKSNFIIRAKCLDSDKVAIAQEQIWSRQISEYTFEICCIPFFAYDLSLGDIVKTDSEHWIIEVLKHSGHYTFRIWFGETNSKAVQDEVLYHIKEANYLTEWYSQNLLAVDVKTNSSLEDFSTFLMEKESTGALTFETGHTK